MSNDDDDTPAWGSDQAGWGWEDPNSLKLPPEPEPVPEDYEPVEAVSQERATKLYAQFLKTYYYDAAGFAENVLGIKLMPHQKAVLDSVSKGSRRISMRSGHRVGKTHLLAIIAVWFITTRYPQKTMVTAPTSGQLFASLYPEIRSLINKTPEFIRSLFTVLSDAIKLKADPDGSFLMARTASPENGESFQGMHSANVLFIWDEAAGIDERLFNAARGSMAAPNALQILAGNPTRLNNTFHRSFTRNANLFERFRISSESCIGKTVDSDFIHEVANTHGRDSNEFRVRVLGEFPDTEDESYIKTTWVRSARKRLIDTPVMAPAIYGVDPARSGADRTVITRRRGRHVIEDQRVIRKHDTMSIVGEIVNMATEDHNRLVQEYREAGIPLLSMPLVPAAIVVDVIGIGAGVVDRLRELGYHVIEVNVAETATSESGCYRERDALYKRMADWLFRAQCSLPDDDELEYELTTPHYNYTSDGSLKIESKMDVKKRIQGRSPDKADSAMLTLAVPDNIFTGFLTSTSKGMIGYGTGPNGKLSSGHSTAIA